MTSTDAFANVTESNVHAINDRLMREGGYILSSWSGGLTGEFNLTLLDRPSLHLDRQMWIRPRHQGSNATNPLEDREYRFALLREQDDIQSLFPSLEIGAFRLTIAAHWGSMGINFGHGEYFYVPEKSHLPEALRHIFENPRVPPNPPLTRDEIEGIITYMLDDLETKAVIREIVEAGMIADVAMIA